MRLFNRLVAVALALFLVVGCVLVAVEIVVAELGNDPWVIPYDRWYEDARAHDWSSGWSLRWFFALTALGLVLLLLQLARRRPAALPMKVGRTEHPAAVSRRGIERSLGRAVGRVDGVASAKARVKRGSVRVKATSNRRQPGDLESRIGEAARQRLSSLGLAQPPSVAVRLQHRGQR